MISTWYKRRVPRPVRFALWLPAYLIGTVLCLLGIVILLPVALVVQVWDNFK